MVGGVEPSSDAGTPEGSAVPVLRPRLPSAERLHPYLKRIDANRIYSNWGPLASELEGRLSDRFGLRSGTTASAGSGTDALIGGILATAGRAADDRQLALLPAFTFVATAAAVEQCGYRPYLADIDAETWSLDAQRLAREAPLDRIGLAVPVAPFGRSVSQVEWVRFKNETGIPVVIDGAASFDRLAGSPGTELGEVPVAISFHATKCFSTGEGGCVISTNSGLVQQVVRALNFGFYGTRETRAASINGKMSEYHAAIGLAELDGWPEKLGAIEHTADLYRKRLALEGMEQRLLAAPEVGASYVLFLCRDAREASRVRNALDRDDIGSRLWYGEGLHRHLHFSELEREPLVNTDRIAPCLVGIPSAPDLTEAVVDRVVEGLIEGLRPD